MAVKKKLQVNFKTIMKKQTTQKCPTKQHLNLMEELAKKSTVIRGSKTALNHKVWIFENIRM